MFFGSAYNNFGALAFLDTFLEIMPQPAPRRTSAGSIEPDAEEFSAFVFKIQANMDKAHRDRMAFLRVCSGRFERGMKVLHVRTDRTMRLANPTQFMAQERTIVEEGYAGDVLGILRPRCLRDRRHPHRRREVLVRRIPQFAPEQFSRVTLAGSDEAQTAEAGSEELAQEGSVQLFKPPKGRDGDPIVGAVGVLQFEVTSHRLEHEYNVEATLEPLSYEYARWIAIRN